MRLFLFLILAGTLVSEVRRRDGSPAPLAPEGKLSTETVQSTEGPRANSSAQGRFNFEDLMEASEILMKKKDYGRAQELLEMALFLKPRDLGIFKFLARIYQETNQADRLAGLAESVSGYLLPEGKEDLFWEQMITQAVILNSRQDADKAWTYFQRLWASLQRRPGRQYELMKELEKKVHAPFLARVYLWLEDNSRYDGFQWGQLGDYFLYIERYEEAAAFFEREFRQESFNPIYLFSYARVLYERKQFALSQVYLNLSTRLNPGLEKVQEEAAKLQHVLGAYPYDYGYEQIRLEADLMLKFGAVEEGISRLRDLLLVSRDVPGTLFELGKTVIGYPDTHGAKQRGRDILLDFAGLRDASFEDLSEALDLLVEAGFLDEAAVLLSALRKKDPGRFEEDEAIAQKMGNLLENLFRNADLLRRNRASAWELLKYLRLCERLSPKSLEVHERMSRIWLEIASEEKNARQDLSPDTQKELNDYLIRFQRNGIEEHPEVVELSARAIRLMRHFPQEQRDFTRELRLLKKALGIASQDAELRSLLAQVYLDQDYALQALDILTPLLGKGYEDANRIGATASRRAAESAWARGGFPEVIRFMELALEYSEDRLIDAESTLWLGRSYQGVERNQDLLDLMDSFEKQFGAVAESWYLKALAFQSQFQYQKAIDAYDRVLADKAGGPFAEACRANRQSLQSILEYQKKN